MNLFIFYYFDLLPCYIENNKGEHLYQLNRYKFKPAEKIFKNLKFNFMHY